MYNFLILKFSTIVFDIHVNFLWFTLEDLRIVVYEVQKGRPHGQTNSDPRTFEKL